MIEGLAKRCLVLAVLAAGCGESGADLAPVSGRVTYDGKPLAGAQLMFQPEGIGSPSYGSADPAGRYELGYKRGVKGAMLGRHLVRIQMDPGASAPNGDKSLPARYNVQTELRRDVVPGGNVMDFDLTSNK
jgi:hypothetical protein